MTRTPEQIGWQFLASLTSIDDLDHVKAATEMPAEVYYAAERIIDGKGTAADRERLGLEKD